MTVLPKDLREYVDAWILGWLLQLIGEYEWVHFHTWVLILVV